MHRANRMRPTVCLLLVLLWPSLAAAAEVAFVAGLRPAERPAGAPVIVAFKPDEAWRTRALHGIRLPPSGLGFLKDQGAWYTPFDRPGLTGPYDLRGWHDQGKARN